MKNFRFLLCTTLLIALLITMALPVMAASEGSPKLYEMYVNDQQVGVVKFPAKTLLIYDNIVKELREEYEEEIFIDYDIYFKEVNTKSNELTSDEKLTKAIVDTIDININSYSITIDGTKICNVGSMEDVQQVMDHIKSPYVEKVEEEENSELEDISFKQDIDVQDEIVPVENVIDPEDATDIILQGNQELNEYQAKEGDSLWLIAQQNGVSVSDLELANPDLDDDIIRPGDTIMIGQQTRLLNVVTKEKVEYSEEIDFDKEVKEDNTLLKGETKTIQEGEKGQKDIVALVTKEDGQEISRDILEETVVKEPVKHIEAKGTKVISKPKNSNSTSTISRGGGSGSGSKVANYAMRFKGYRYVFGTSGPNTFDCSGFTKYVYGRFGVSLPHSSGKQQSVGSAVSRKNLRPGDILCFSGHVGIYIGKDQFIHASNKKHGVKINKLSSFNKPLITARRIFK